MFNKGMAKMGRPRIGKKPLSTKIDVRVSPAEKRAWEREAKRVEMSLGQWIVAPRREEFGVNEDEAKKNLQ